MSISHWGIFPGNLSYWIGYDGIRYYYWYQCSFSEWVARQDYWELEAELV